MLPGGLTRVALPRGLAGGQLQPGRRVQGHLGAGVAVVGGRPRAGAAEQVVRKPAAVEARQGADSQPQQQPAQQTGQQQQQQQQQQQAGDALMLARNAESLYWIGRYVERADDTARILDVTVHQLLEDSSVDPDQASRILLQVLGIEPPDAPARPVVADRSGRVQPRAADGGCSIVDAITAARENARSAQRSHLQRDVGVPQHHLQRARRTRTRGPAARPARVLLLRRGPGRDVRRAGRLDAVPRRRLPVPGARPGHRARRHDGAPAAVPGRRQRILAGLGDGAAAAGAHDTYLRTYRGVLDANRVVEFMLLDRLFPRSVVLFAALGRAQPRRTDRQSPAQPRRRRTAEAQRLLGRARSELEFLRPGVLLESLEERLAGLQATCRDVGEALALQYFHSAPWVAWTDAGQAAGSLVDRRFGIGGPADVADAGGARDRATPTSRR